MERASKNFNMLNFKMSLYWNHIGQYVNDYFIIKTTQNYIVLNKFINQSFISQYYNSNNSIHIISIVQVNTIQIVKKTFLEYIHTFL